MEFYTGYITAKIDCYFGLISILVMHAVNHLLHHYILDCTISTFLYNILSHILDTCKI